MTTRVTLYNPAFEKEYWIFSPEPVLPSPKFHWYVAFSLIPFENWPIPVKSIVSSTSTSIEPLLTPGVDVIDEVTSWHGSKQLIIASHPLACAAPLLKNWMVRQPVGLSAWIKPGLDVAVVPENTPNWVADVSSPL